MTVVVLFATSALTQRLSFGRDPLALQRLGLAALAAGVGLLCWAGVAGLVWLLLAASIIAGIGQGTAFLGAMTEINAVAPPARHAEVLSGFYVVAYLGTGIPVLGVGSLATAIGLLSAVEWFSAGAAAAAIALLGALHQRSCRAPAANGRPEAPPGQRSTATDRGAADPPIPRPTDEHRPSRGRLRRPGERGGAPRPGPPRCTTTTRSRMAHRPPDPRRSNPHRHRRPPPRRSDTVVVDNHHAMDGDAITAVLATLAHHDRIHAIKHNASELIDRHRRIPDTAGTTTVHLLLHDRHGQPTHQGTTSWAALLTTRADPHLPGHARTLRRLAGPSS